MSDGFFHFCVHAVVRIVTYRTAGRRRGAAGTPAFPRRHAARPGLPVHSEQVAYGQFTAFAPPSRGRPPARGRRTHHEGRAFGEQGPPIYGELPPSGFDPPPPAGR